MLWRRLRSGLGERFAFLNRPVSKTALSILFLLFLLVGWVFLAMVNRPVQLQIRVRDAYNAARIEKLLEEFRTNPDAGEDCLERLDQNISLCTSAPLYHAFLLTPNARLQAKALQSLAEAARYQNQTGVEGRLLFDFDDLNLMPMLAMWLTSESFVSCLQSVPDCLENSNGDVRYSAALALVAINPRDNRAEPVLFEMLNRADFGSARDDAAILNGLCLKEANRQMVASRLMELLHSDEVMTIMLAAEYLGKLRWKAALADLTVLLGDDNDGVRHACASALGSIGVPAFESIEQLVVMSTISRDDHKAVVRALRRFGNAGERLPKELRKVAARRPGLADAANSLLVAVQTDPWAESLQILKNIDLVANMDLAAQFGREELVSNRELKAFALSYHNFYAAKHVGPSSLDDLVKDESSFPKAAQLIRSGSLIVIWQENLRPTAEENSNYFLAYERGVEEKKTWVLFADGRPERISPPEFKVLTPLPKK